MRLRLLGTLIVLASAVIAADLTPASYCQILKATLDLSAREWQERIAVLRQSGSTAEKRARVSAIETRYASNRASLFVSAGTGRAAWMKFGSTNGKEIRAYLAKEHAVRAAVDDAQAKVTGLIAEAEALAEGGAQ